MATFLRMNRTALYWLCQLSWFSVYLLVGVASNGLPKSGGEWFFFLSGPIFLLLTTHLFRMFIHRRKWIKLYLAKLLPRVLGAVAVLTLMYYAFSVITVYSYQQVLLSGNVPTEINPNDSLVFDATAMALPSPDSLLAQAEVATVLVQETEPKSLLEFAADPYNFFSYLFNGFIVYFIWSTIYFMFHYVESYNQTLKYEAAINEIELNKLKSQLNPHFIFNALNSIRALVDEDPRKSKIAITQLSTILRNSLIMDKKRLIPFTEEMVTVKDYLALETIRFEERLKTDFVLHPDSYRFEVPPLMVQTLVENAIKHGISNLAAGGIVRVETHLLKAEEKLAIRIYNSGKYVNGAKRKGTGYGIDNTKQRLRLIFGQEASFSIDNEAEGMVLTEVIIPQKP